MFFRVRFDYSVFGCLSVLLCFVRFVEFVEFSFKSLALVGVYEIFKRLYKLVYVWRFVDYFLDVLNGGFYVQLLFEVVANEEGLFVDVVSHSLFSFSCVMSSRSLMRFSSVSYARAMVRSSFWFWGVGSSLLSRSVSSRRVGSLGLRWVIAVPCCCGGAVCRSGGRLGCGCVSGGWWVFCGVVGLSAVVEPFLDGEGCLLSLLSHLLAVVE